MFFNGVNVLENEFYLDDWQEYLMVWYLNIMNELTKINIHRMNVYLGAWFDDVHVNSWDHGEPLERWIRFIRLDDISINLQQQLFYREYVQVYAWLSSISDQVILRPKKKLSILSIEKLIKRIIETFKR